MTARAYTVTADHPVDTDTGQVVAPGEHFTADGSERLRDLTAAGLIEPGKTPKPEETS